MSAAFDPATLRSDPLAAAVRAIGGKWKPQILWALRHGSMTFGVLTRTTGASEKMMARRLRDLVNAGVITRRSVKRGEIVTTEYSYTESGRALLPVLEGLRTWGEAIACGNQTRGEGC